MIGTAEWIRPAKAQHAPEFVKFLADICPVVWYTTDNIPHTSNRAEKVSDGDKNF
jgi:hypothetical protein